MDIYLENRKRDINAFKKAITLCKNDTKTADVLKKYLTKIEEEFSYADFLKLKFIPLIHPKDNFYRSFIFCTDGGEYKVEVYINNADENAKNEYTAIFDKFCKENEGTFFYFEVYDIDKDRDIYNEARDFDKLVITKKV